MATRIPETAWILVLASGLLVTSGPLAAPVYAQTTAGTETVLEERVTELEARVDALERRLEALADADEDVGPAQPPAVAVPDPTVGAMPGWQTTLFPLDPNDPRARRTAYGSYASERVGFPLKLVRQSNGVTARQPVGIANDTVFVPNEAGWHSFGFVFTFPPVGFSGLLAGFECFVDIMIDDEVVLETSVRMPYGLRNRTKDVLASQRLEARPYRISEWIACQPDGRQSADPTDALDAIRVERTMKRPEDRRVVVAEPEQFRLPEPAIQ